MNEAGESAENSRVESFQSLERRRVLETGE